MGGGGSRWQSALPLLPCLGTESWGADPAAYLESMK